MELHGYPFTWERYPGTNKWVEIRLNRAIATSSWMHLFKDARLINLKASTSDHNPILLVPMAVDGLPRVRKQKFENAWLRDPVFSTLMVTNERRWDEDLIKDVFLERDANLILAIPLADNNVDGWYWRKDNEVESIEHLFLDCSFAKSCWITAGISWNFNDQMSFRDWAVKEFNEW
ncbi:hypothetical protein POM88_012121 [Heracleum sosnowskyi]|uniref:Uncharacterized protein n=1 Tax=Heracleum sosnowskyi TaxID=360622 RepID=A0AAD8IW52_9APIA|nr:hypothetical protein POM88_012121 [Heracleum sosnowskyi]